MTRHPDRAFSRRTLGVVLMLLLLSGVMAAAALGDDPPPATTVVVTVTTPPVTAPPPDPAPTVPPKSKPVLKPHPHAAPKVTPKPASTSSPTHSSSNAGTANSTGSSFRPPTVVRPKTTAQTHKRKRPTAAPKHHKVKAVAPKPKPKPKPVTTHPVAPTAAKPVQKTAAPAAVHPRGSSQAQMLALFALVASLLLASMTVLGVRRRRHPRAVAAVAATTAELPVLERVPEPLPTRAIVMEPPVIPVVESRNFVEELFEAEFVEVPVVDDRCEITAWRGYAKWRFYGRIDTGAGEVALVESRPFRAPGSTGPEATPAAKAAHEELTARLVSEGWVPVDGGAQWFESSFIRRDAQEPAAPATDVAQHEVLEPDAVT